MEKNMLKRTLNSQQLRFIKLGCRRRWFSTTKKVNLHVANPQALLNAIASTYKSLPRILMEYVDNAIDAGQEVRKRGAEWEDFILTVAVDIDSVGRTIWVRDNGPGMGAQGLSSVVGSVGDSKKRGVPWLNGQFGFGVHSFRAAASKMCMYSSAETFPTRNSKHSNLESITRLSLDRTQTAGELCTVDLANDEFIQPAIHRGIFASTNNSFFPISNQFPNRNINDGGSPKGLFGTVAALVDVDPVWFSNCKARSIATDIENHFEAVLYDGKTKILVSQTNASSTRGGGNKLRRVDLECMPFDYSSVDGQFFDRDIQIGTGENPQFVKCQLVVSNNISLNRSPRFFCKGRSINTVMETRSFMQDSEVKGRLWEHPGVAGRVDVTGVLEPVLTRDEFKRTKERSSVYDALRTLEQELVTVLEKMIAATVDQSMTEVEDLLGEALADAMTTQFSSKPSEDPAETEVTEIEDQQLVAETTEATTSTSDTEATEAVPVEKDSVVYERVVKARSNKSPKKKNSAKGAYDWQVRFVRSNSTESESARRSFVVESTLFINVEHEDFKSRIQRDKQGNLVFGRRLAPYLANEIACSFQDSIYDRTSTPIPHDRHSLYADLVSSSIVLEKLLNKRLSTRVPDALFESSDFLDHTKSSDK